MSKFNVLNIGSRSSNIELPHMFQDHFNIINLDVDPKTDPDICCDLLDLPRREDLPLGEGGLRTRRMFDAVYASHVLEHFSPFDSMAALRAMVHVLKPGGFALIRIPSIEMLVLHCQTHGLGFQESLHQFTGIPRGVSGQNVIFGMPLEGPWMAHKRHYTGLELVQELKAAGFTNVEGGFYPHAIEIMVIAFGEEMDPELKEIVLKDTTAVYLARSHLKENEKEGNPEGLDRNLLTTQ